MANRFYTLSVSDVTRQSKDAVTLTLDVPPSLYSTFDYKPGQHLNIKFVIDGKEARRSYSLNSCPQKWELLQVTVKRARGGLVSNYVNDRLQVGDQLEVMPPTGTFAAAIDADHYKHYFLFGAGSGITPLLSILRSVLEAEKHSFVHLFYGNRNLSSMLFRGQLEELQKQYQERFMLVHVLTEPYSDWTWSWKGRKGRIDKEAVESLVAHHPPRAQSAHWGR